MNVRELLEHLKGVDPDTPVEVTVVDEPYDCMPYIGKVGLVEGNRSYFELQFHYFSGDGWES